jgi:hypothetical protein
VYSGHSGTGFDERVTRKFIKKLKFMCEFTKVQLEMPVEETGKIEELSNGNYFLKPQVPRAGMVRKRVYVNCKTWEDAIFVCRYLCILINENYSGIERVKVWGPGKAMRSDSIVAYLFDGRDFGKPENCYVDHTCERITNLAGASLGTNLPPGVKRWKDAPGIGWADQPIQYGLDTELSAGKKVQSFGYLIAEILYLTLYGRYEGPSVPDRAGISRRFRRPGEVVRGTEMPQTMPPRSCPEFLEKVALQMVVWGLDPLNPHLEQRAQSTGRSPIPEAWKSKSSL